MVRMIRSLSGPFLLPERPQKTEIASPDGRMKLELAIAKGKKLYDKRHTLAERDADRERERRIKEDRS